MNQSYRCWESCKGFLVFHFQILSRNSFFTLYLLWLLAGSAHSDLSDGSIRFVDITKSAGIDFLQVSGDPRVKNLIVEAKGGGLALLDADGDGWLDIYFVNGRTFEKTNGPPPKNKLFRNNHDGTFSDITDAAGVGDEEWGMGCAAADYDNDGDADLYVTNYGPNRLFRNDGKGRFTDVIGEAGCQSPLYSTGAAFADYDLDGFVDLVVSDYLDLESLNHLTPEQQKAEWRGYRVYPGPRAYTPLGISLFHNRGDGTFEDVTEASGIGDALPAYSFTCAWVDVNNDRYPDFYVANDSMPSYLFMNNGDGTFTENGLLAGVAYSEDGTEMASMGVAWGDCNGDFQWDLLGTNFSEEPFTLWLGCGDGLFADCTYSSGVGHKTFSSLGWGTEWIDVDNDGDEDMFFCNGHVYPEADHPDVDTTFAQPPLLFENLGEVKFIPIDTGLGEDFYKPRISRGCVSGDIDNDGDLDLVINNLGGTPTILRNDGGNQNHWLQILLHGTRSNRSAIGAFVKLTAGNLKEMKGVFSGSSFLSQDSTILHFGLGILKKADRIEIHWPSGTVTVLEDVAANQRLPIVEDAKDTTK
jgi:hypothetical protein